MVDFLPIKIYIQLLKEDNQSNKIRLHPFWYGYFNVVRLYYSTEREEMDITDKRGEIQRELPLIKVEFLSQQLLYI